MRALSFRNVTIRWLGAPGLRLDRDLAGVEKAVSWVQNQPDRYRIDDGVGGTISVRNPSRSGSATLAIVAGSRSHLALKAITQAADAVSNLPAPLVIRDSGTGETTILLGATVRGVPLQSKGAGVPVFPWVWDYDRAVEIVGDLDAAEIGG